MDKNNINNNHFSFTDKYYEFSSYTSKIDEFNTNNVSNNNEINDKYEILERIGCVSLDGFEMSKKWEFKDYILISEKEENVKEKIVGIKKQKSKSSI